MSHSSPQQTHPSPNTSPAERIQPRRDDNIGYLGPTSFSAVIEETRGNLTSVQLPAPRDDDDNDDAGTNVVAEAETTTLEAVDQATLEIGIEIIRMIPDRDTSNVMFGKQRNPCDSWCRLAALRCKESMWDTFGHILEGDRTRASLEHMATIISKNSKTVFVENQTDPDEWVGCFSGPNMRWETLGSLFAYWALGALSFSEHSTKQVGKLKMEQRRQRMVKYKAMAVKCIELCRRNSSLNTVVLYVLYKNTLLESMVSGDASMCLVVSSQM